jgi:hypothetical protein
VLFLLLRVSAEAVSDMTDLKTASVAVNLSMFLSDHLLRELSALISEYLTARPITWDTETGWANPFANIAATVVRPPSVRC